MMAMQGRVVISGLLLVSLWPALSMAEWGKPLGGTYDGPEGKPRLVAFESANGDHTGLLSLAASVQAGSVHPLAKAVMNRAEEHLLTLAPAQDAKAVAGRGMSAQVKGRALSLGSTRWMQELGVDLSPLASRAQELEDEGRTVSWLAEGAQPAQLLGLLAFGDAAKSTAREAVDSLREMGVRSVMVTGDNKGAARVAAHALGITDVRAEVLP
ncbi:MAG: HAD family hydrolase, partial [Nitrospirota bacterium]|nr:HAD family hydrolase [Nitrospirota bacterium]